MLLGLGAVGPASFPLPNRLLPLGSVVAAVVFVPLIFSFLLPKGGSGGNAPRQQDVSGANSDYRGFADTEKLSTGHFLCFVI